jgi:hypothetical protein
MRVSSNARGEWAELNTAGFHTIEGLTSALATFDAGQTRVADDDIEVFNQDAETNGGPSLNRASWRAGIVDAIETLRSWREQANE